MRACRPLNPPSPLHRPALAMAVLLTALLAACGQGAASGAPGAGGPPPPEVGVVTVTPGDVGLVTELPGRLEASRIAQVRARAAGIERRIMGDVYALDQL